MQKPPPCYQDWNSMKEVSGGRLCEQCQNTIVDFTKISWEDILAKQKVSDFTTCGKYSEKQIRHWGYQPPVLEFHWFKKISFTSLFLLLGFKSADAQVVDKPKIEIVDSSESGKEIKQDSAWVKYKGKVIDSATGEPLLAALIIDEVNSFGAYTNEEGCFEFSERYNRIDIDSVKFTVRYIGYKDQTVYISARRQNVIKLNSQDKYDLSGVVFRVEPEPKLKPIRKIKNWFRKK